MCCCCRSIIRKTKPWFTISQVTGVFWAPPFEGPLSVEPELVEPYYDAYATFADILEQLKST